MPKHRGGDRPKIFLGSSSEKKREAEEIEAILKSEGWDVIAWWKPALFPPGKTIFATLMRLGPSLDAAILIFSDDDKIWFRGHAQGAPRDNVLIEYGLFTGIVGGTEDDRVIICRIGQPKQASDLAGITYIQYDSSQQTSFISEVRPWLEQIKVRSENESHGMARVYTTRQRKELFLSGESIVRAAQNDLVLCARTPVPIVGTRPYDETSDPSDHELTQLDAYEQALASLSASNSKRILLVGCVSSLAKDLNMYGVQFQARVKSRLESLYAQAGLYKPRLVIRWTVEENVPTFVSGDSDLIIWFKNNDGENVWFHCSNIEMSRTLRQFALRMSTEMSLSDIFNKLKI